MIGNDVTLVWPSAVTDCQASHLGTESEHALVQSLLKVAGPASYLAPRRHGH